MSKPEDIPQAVWDAADITYDEARTCTTVEQSVLRIARAILAATAAEREACASMLEDINVDYLDRFSAAAAIRKRED